MAGPRARRRSVVLVIAAVTLTAIVLLAKGGASGQPNNSEAVQTYLDEVRPGVQQSIEQGADFADARSEASTLGRDGIDRRLQRLMIEVNSTLTSIDTLTPPPSLRVAQAYLVAALGVRAKAVNEAGPAMDSALTVEATPDQGVSDAAAALATVGQDLGLGDRAFNLFVQTLPADSGISAGAPWLTDPGEWTPIELTAYVDTLRSSATAKPVYDMAMLAFQTDPAAVSVAADGTQTIPASSETTVSMVIENVGNQPESNVTVMVILSLAGGGERTLRDFINLAPSQTRSLTLGPLPTDPGMAGTLVVEVEPVAGEIETGNNAITTQVQFR